MRTIQNTEIRCVDGRFKCDFCEKSYSARHVLYGHLLKVHEIRVVAVAGRSRSAEYRRRSAEVRNMQSCQRTRRVCTSDSEDELDHLRVINPDDNDICSSQNTDQSVQNDDSQSQNSLSEIPGLTSFDNDYEITTDEETEDCITPQYIINFSDQHKLTLDELYITLLVFAEHNCLTQKAMCNLFSLANIFFPDNSRLDYKIRQIEKVIGYNRNEIKEHLYCRRCSTPRNLDVNLCTKPSCRSPDSNYFVTFPIAEQLHNILGNGMWETVQANKREPRDGTYKDILDGDLYKRLSAPGCFLHSDNDTISLSVFIDGMRLFKSSKQSLWPIFMLVNEIPLHERFKRKNMIQFGIWQGTGKPNFSHFLAVLREYAEQAYREGFDIEIGGRSVRIKVLFLLFIADLPGRAYILDMTFFNGSYSCLFCYVKGADGLSTKSFDFSLRVMDRTPMDTLRDAIAATPQNRVYGFKGFSELHLVPEFTSKSVPIETMHGAFLGVTKTLIQLWFFKRKSSVYIGHNLDEIDALLVKFMPPNSIHRSPRPIALYKKWKANEFRNFLFYYSLPLLKGYLDREVYAHYSKFVEGVYILHQESITREEVDYAETQLIEFVSLFHTLYRNKRRRVPLTLNIHNAIHYADCVRNWSNLFNFTAFPYESFSGEIGRKISGTGQVIKSLYFTHFIHQKGGDLHDKASGNLKELLDKIVTGTSYKIFTRVDPDIILLGNPTDASLQDEQLILQAGFYVEMQHLLVIQKLIKQKIYIDSELCTGVKRKTSRYVLVEENEYDVQIVKVHHYVYDTEDKQVYAICRKVLIDSPLIPNCALHIVKIEEDESDQFFAMHLRDLLRPVVIMKMGDDVYAAKMPNRYERD